MRLGCCSSFWGHTVTAVAVPPLVHGGNIQYLVTVGKKNKKNALPVSLRYSAFRRRASSSSPGLGTSFRWRESWRPRCRPGRTSPGPAPSRQRSNDRDVVLGVVGVQREDSQAQADDDRNVDHKALEEEVEVVQGKGHASADIVDEDKGISIVPSGTIESFIYSILKTFVI